MFSQISTIFAGLLSFLISVETCQSLLKRDLKRNLFMLFSTWSGKYAVPVKKTQSSTNVDLSSKKGTELQFAALQAMSALLCCGPCFDAEGLAEDGPYYQWLDVMLESSDEKVSRSMLLQ